MGKPNKRECRICNQTYHRMFVPDKQNAFWGRLVTCPLCDGSGRIDDVRWVAYQLLATTDRPTYEEIVKMVQDLNAAHASEAR